MARVQLYILFDTIAMTTLGHIVQANREEQAIRSFREILEQKDTAPGSYPADFVMLHIGEQNTETGELTSKEPTPIYTGKLHLAQKEYAAGRAGQTNITNPSPNGDSDVRSPDPIKEDLTNRAERHVRAI